jgi:hypothetical protein
LVSRTVCRYRVSRRGREARRPLRRDGLVKPPVFVVEGWDVTTYESPESAARWMEAPDVRDGIFKIYDSAGLRLTPWAASDDAPVEIVVSPEAPREPDQLAAVLRRFLLSPPRRKLPVADERIETMALPELVKLMVRDQR